jgi:hypothetical protein
MEHISEFGETDDGWPTVACSCGWAGAGPLPDMETAADEWGDHRAWTALTDRIEDGWRIVRFDPNTVEQGPLIITEEWTPNA